MGQSGEQLVYAPGQIDVSNVDAWIHFWDPTRRRRLRNRLFGVLTLAVALNYYVWAFTSMVSFKERTLLMELISAVVAAFVMKALIARRVHGNSYRELSVGHRLGAAVCIAGLVSLVYVNAPVRRWVLASSLPTIALLSFLLSSILTFVWLIGYEKRNGPVYIVEDTPRASA